MDAMLNLHETHLVISLQTVAKRSTSEKKSVEIQLNFTEQQLEDSQASEQRLRAANVRPALAGVL